MSPSTGSPSTGNRAQIVEAALTWTGEAFAAGLQVEVDADGRIARAGELGAEPTQRLPGRALLPGFVNAHSHAFQRGLRGRGESFPRGSGSFWTWREAMYALLEELDAGQVRDLSLQAFREMRAAGITTVGEFHYLHHDRGADAGFAVDPLILEAAAEAGIRIVLLQAYYATGGIGRPLAGGQLRFRTPSPDTYWRQLDRLAADLDPATQSLGAVAHSIRAVPLGDLRALWEEARRRELPFHMHVEEQPREMVDCQDAYGATPMALLTAELDLDDRFTAVHCTHTRPRDLDRFLAGGGRACICPTTEANLADGIADLDRLWSRGGALALGSDSNVRIAPFEEMRWLEYVQRLVEERRGVLHDAGGRVAAPLLRAATAGGADALGVPAGRIEPGRWADFALVDLGHPTLAGADAGALADALVFGASEEVVVATCVGGRWEEHRAGS